MSAPEIHAMILSRNRAMQLDALLTSLERRAPWASVTVTTASGFDDGYHVLIHDHPDVAFWIRKPDDTLEDHVHTFVEWHDRIVFHTDDEIMFRTPADELFDVDDNTIVTLRQGRNTVKCHPLGWIDQPVPESFPWLWRHEQLDFAYPLSINSTVYQSDDIRPLLNFPFRNGTHLEAGLAAQQAFLRPQWMTAPEHSCTVSLPHNVVSPDTGCPRGSNPLWQADSLRDMYLNGWRLDLDQMDFTDVRAGHQEIPLKFRKEA